MKNDKTKNFYNNNSKSYILKTKDIILYKQITNFLNYIKLDETILDLGCGSGNNLKEFKNQGYKAVGIDYSQKLVDFAKNHSETNVYCVNFSNINQINKFIRFHHINHIFASSSLLHLTKKQFLSFLNTLEFSGIMFFSLKEGISESVDENGRFFSYYSKDEVENILIKRFQILGFNKEKDILGRSINWLNWFIKIKK